jgi:hypothetical protein
MHIAANRFGEGRDVAAFAVYLIRWAKIPESKAPARQRTLMTTGLRGDAHCAESGLKAPARHRFPSSSWRLSIG